MDRKKLSQFLLTIPLRSYYYAIGRIGYDIPYFRFDYFLLFRDQWEALVTTMIFVLFKIFRNTTIVRRVESVLPKHCGIERSRILSNKTSFVLYYRIMKNTMKLNIPRFPLPLLTLCLTFEIYVTTENTLWWFRWKTPTGQRMQKLFLSEPILDVCSRYSMFG